MSDKIGIRYYVGESQNDTVNYESDGTSARWVSTDGTCYASLCEGESGDNFIFRWQYPHEKGSVKIPSHIIYSLSDLLTVLNHASGNIYCEETRFYEKIATTPLAVLFPGTRNRKPK
jgi:hypothetical protein